MNEVISVLMLVHNAERTVSAAVESILNQSERSFRFIIVDDGSSDGTANVLHSLSDPRIDLLSLNENRGIVAALNAGLERCKSPWIARMDADDVSHPDRLRRQLEYALTNPACAAVKCRVSVSADSGEGMKRYVDWVNSLKGPESIAAGRFIENPVIHPSAMIRRDWLDRIGGYHDSVWAEDHDLWMRLIEAGGEVMHCEEAVVEWRDSRNRLTRSDPRYSEGSRTALRANYLARVPAIAERGVVVAGAGPIGKCLVRALLGHGVRVHAFLDVSTKRIGQTIHGVRVSDAAGSIGSWPEAVLLGAVGVSGGRGSVRALAEQAGRMEGVDFWAVC